MIVNRQNAFQKYNDYYNLETLHEAYIGKTPILLEIEDQVNKIRAICNKFKDIDKHAEVQKLNRLFEKQFGMDVFALHVVHENVINAYTIPVNTRFDIALKENISKKVTGSKDTGYRFKEGNNLAIVCTVYLGLLNCPDLTDEEIVAIILHELGHNFADAIYDKIKVANKSWAKSYYNYLIFYTIITFGLGYKAIADNKNKNVAKKEKKARYNPLRGIWKGINGTFSNLSSFVNECLARLLGGSDFVLYKSSLSSKQKDEIKEKTMKSIGRQNEVIADKFAGVYGYGPAQGSALLKMEKHESNAAKFVQKIPVIGAMQNDSFEIAYLDITDFDVHPQVIQRIHEEIKLLNNELKSSNLDPKLEKVLKEQIKELQDMIEDAINVAENASKVEKARANYYALINNTAPDAVTEELEDAIEKALNDALNKE